MHILGPCSCFLLKREFCFPLLLVSFFQSAKWTWRICRRGEECYSSDYRVHFATWTLLWMQRAGWLFAPKAIADELARPPVPLPFAPTHSTPSHHNPNSLSSATFPRSCSIVYVMFWQNEKSEAKNNSWSLRIRQVVPPKGKGLTLRTTLVKICISDINIKSNSFKNTKRKL